MKPGTEGSPVLIPLHDRTGEVVAHALIDPEDMALAKWRWYRCTSGYVKRIVSCDDGTGRRRLLKLHREVLGLDPGDERQGDHVNGNRLDLSPSEPAQAKLNGRKHRLGRFDSEEEAAEAASAFRLAHMPFTNEDRRASSVRSGHPAQYDPPVTPESVTIELEPM